MQFPNTLAILLAAVHLFVLALIARAALVATGNWCHVYVNCFWTQSALIVQVSTWLACCVVRAIMQEAAAMGPRTPGHADNQSLRRVATHRLLNRIASATCPILRHTKVRSFEAMDANIAAFARMLLPCGAVLVLAQPN